VQHGPEAFDNRLHRQNCGHPSRWNSGEAKVGQRNGIWFVEKPYGFRTPTKERKKSKPIRYEPPRPGHFGRAKAMT
jgi:hypothetical protein